MFRHAWEGYKAAAFGHDEVHPVTNTTNDSWGGFGITLVDTLDTMALMKFDEYLEEAREVKNLFLYFSFSLFLFSLSSLSLGSSELKFFLSLVSFLQAVAHINYNKDYDASFFETTIRHLGGLLGAYEMTRDYLYLSKGFFSFLFF